MAIPQTETVTTAAGEPLRPAPRATLSVAEAVVLAATLLLSLLAVAGLALAGAGRYRLPAAVTVAALAALGLGLVAWRGGRVRLLVDRTELAAVLGVGLVAAVLFFPGFPYGVGKDPGVYVSHGMAIARTGAASYPDPVLDRSRIPRVEVTPEDTFSRFAAVWIADRSAGRVVLQFYHLWPALLASAFAAAGYAGLSNLTPLCGVLAVLCVVLAARRAFGLLTGVLAGLLLAANMLEVWQAKYPSSETFAQLLVAGALLGVVVALRTGWRPAAGLAGLLVGVVYLARPDGLLLVLLAVGAGCVLLVAGRFDARAGWFAAGLAVILPYGFFQAYVTARRYTLANHVPDLPVILAAIAGALAAAALLRLAAPAVGRWGARLAERRPAQLRAGAVIVVLAAAGLALGFLRQRLFGPVSGEWLGRPYRTYDEVTLQRLSLFVTVPGFVLALAGLALVALRRWQAAAWALILPMLCLLPLYAYRASVAPRLMWWTRRFVPVILPGLAVLIAVALGAGLALAAGGARGGRAGATGGSGAGRLRWPARAVAALVAAVAAVALLVVFAGQSLPLRDHREHGGSFEITRRIAAAAGDRQGVFLWDQGTGATSLFGSAVWLQQDQVSALLPRRPDPAYVRSFLRGFPGQPVFVVARGHAPPRAYAGLGLRPVDKVSYDMPVWEETFLRRPAAATEVPLRFAIWRVGAGP